jgi:hypothetical protein
MLYHLVYQILYRISVTFCRINLPYKKIDPFITHFCLTFHAQYPHSPYYTPYHIYPIYTPSEHFLDGPGSTLNEIILRSLMEILLLKGSITIVGEDLPQDANCVYSQ